MAQAELSLLGGFALRRSDGNPIELPGQKDRALLAIIALQAGSANLRERLAGLLWSDRGDQQARDSLKHALTRLRRCLDGNGESPIRADRLTVSLAVNSLAVDAVDFEHLLRTGTAASLSRAASLYRGALLEGIAVRDPAFEDWLQVERQRLENLYDEALARLLARLIDDGERERAAEIARQLLARDPLHEAACRALMRVEADQGHTVQALRRFETLRERLRAEVGAEPEPETVSLQQAILSRRSEAVQGRAPAAASPAVAAGRPAIAVLPFENLSDDPEQRYFSDGITADIVTELSRFRSLLVVSGGPFLALRERPAKIQDIACELGVSFVVEGSVRRALGRVRVSAQLVDGSSGSHLWAERYDRDVLDLLAVQDEVARAVAATVTGRVVDVGRDRVARLSTTEMKAYDLVSRARSLTLKCTKENNEEALACAERAVLLDPASASAHIHAAWCLFYNHMACWTIDLEQTLARAYDMAQRAVELDETDSFSHTMLGIIHLFRKEFDAARTEILEGLARNPNDFLARRYYAMYLAATGDPEAGIEQIEIGRRLNPFDTRWVPWNRGIVFFTARRYEEAIAAFKLARNPVNEVRGWLAASLGWAGYREEANTVLEEFLRIAQADMAVFPGRRLRDWETYWHCAFAYRDPDDFAHLYEGLRRAGLQDGR